MAVICVWTTLAPTCAASPHLSDQIHVCACNDLYGRAFANLAFACIDIQTYLCPLDQALCFASSPPLILIAVSSRSSSVASLFFFIIILLHSSSSSSSFLRLFFLLLVLSIPILLLILVMLTQVYPGALVDGRLMAAFQHLVASQGQEPKKAEAAVAARCQQLLAAMSPLPEDLKALAADPWTEQDDRWYYVTAAQQYGVVRRR